MGNDPVENLVAENSSEEIKQRIRKKYNLDLSFGKRYVLYLNDLSPISIHKPSEEKSRIYYNDKRYSGKELFALSGEKALYIKFPYLGRSYLNERNVHTLIGEAVPGTFMLAISAILIALIIGLTIGVYSALNKGSLGDQLITFFSVIGMSGPSFFMAIIIAWIGGWLWYEVIPVPVIPIFFLLLFGALVWLYNRKQRKSLSVFKYSLIGLLFGILMSIIFGNTTWLGYQFHLPGTGLSMHGSWFEVDVWTGKYVNLKNLILPAITLGIRPLAVIVQLTRSAMLDVLSQDYIRTAKSKGLSKTRIVIFHALRNALNPVITAVSGWFASLLAGAVFVEFVFGYKGLGMLTYNALEKDDLPVVMGAVLVIAVTFGIINFLVDMAYGILDPRIRKA